MKEFERQFKNLDCSIDCGDFTCEPACKRVRANTWRAALEWTMTQDTDLNATELADAIRKELEDERI